MVLLDASSMTELRLAERGAHLVEVILRGLGDWQNGLPHLRQKGLSS